ncbi:copper amine oxidase [Tothia fuscella]|uniref:Amine oxidase n=1 Tax=Tothia fuscella TaxID=1048955 RepID=A0A9P4U5A3_9PEZI|nr:copper amine oxidase [Tothia fuscella]
MAFPHPLSGLSVEETNIAREVVLASLPNTVVDFRTTSLQEPAKADLIKFLDLEHAGKLTADSPRPPRLARVHYDAVDGSKVPKYMESVVDVEKKERVEHELVSTESHPSLTVHEFETFVEICNASPLFQARIKDLKLPEGFEIVVEPWPYGGLDKADENRRYFQGLIFAVDAKTKNPDSNFYPFPLPIIPIMDWVKRTIISIEELATGGNGDPLSGKTHAAGVLDHCHAAEYVPELLPGGTRTDLRELNVVQPNGPSFSVTDDNLIEWQKWRFRVTFNPREGAVLHDICYDGRSILYRLGISEMTVPYADPRPPFHRKQAFDFGDGGIGNCTNNLELGCDCLGVIKYFDGVIVGPDGYGHKTPNVICLHEQDNGLNWKHTNWRTGRAVASRRRELVVQFIITLANYEYIFNYKFDQAAGITVEARATGIVSVVNIDEGKKASWGNVVSPGALAQNHQHIFCVRIDPAIDGHANTVIQQESLPLLMDSRTNPKGNFYEVRDTTITTSVGLDAAPQNNRCFKIQNLDKINPISGKPIGYKIVPPPTQKLLAHPNSIQAKRALFAQHHMWITKYKENELYAGGRYTLQSTIEKDGVHDAAARNDDVLQEDIVVWNVFGLTHNPRIEDWPVMPVEIIQMNITPADFFAGNPALDVPSSRNLSSKLTTGRSLNGTNGATTTTNGDANGTNGDNCCS